MKLRSSRRWRLDCTRLPPTRAGMVRPIRAATRAGARLKTSFCLAVLLMLFAATGRTQVPAGSHSNAPVSSKPQLHYFVIDRSGSVVTNGLVIPIRGALLQTVGAIDAADDVRVVMFSTTAAPKQTWVKMDTNAKGEFSAWFDQSFKPAGNTRLFDTVGEALEDIQRDRAKYRSVTLTILSDGLEEPPISTRFKSWNDLAPLVGDLVAGDTPFFGTWYTLGFVPGQKAPAGIETKAIPDASQFRVDPPTPPPPAKDLPVVKFAASAQGGTIPLRVEFRDETQSKSPLVKWAWEFGDGSRSDQRNPAHTYSQAGSYRPRLTVTNAVGESGISDGELAIAAASPPPPPAWWVPVVRAAALIVAALLLLRLTLIAWLGGRVRPGAKTGFKGARTILIAPLLARQSSSWLWPKGLWPRRFLTMGSTSSDDIKIASSPAKTVAVLKRNAFSGEYILHVLDPRALSALSTRTGVSGQPETVATPIGTSVRELRDGAQLRIGDEDFGWHDSEARPTRGKRKETR